MNAVARRTTIALASLALFGGAVFGLASPAAAAPYGSTTLTVTVGDTTPLAGGSVTVKVTGAGPGDRIPINIGSVPVGLVTADPNGTATGTVTIPCGLSGSNHVVASDNGSSGSAAINIQRSAAASDCTLASTGLDVAGMGGIALSLLSVGALMCIGRRRHDHSS